MQLDLYGPAASGRVGGRMPLAGATPVLQALSADANLLARAGRLGGQVHSVFERAVNVMGTDGGLYTLAARTLDDGPQTARVDVAGWRATGVRVGDPVNAADGNLWIGELLGVALDAATPWHRILPAYPHDPATLRANLPVLRAALAEHAAASRENFGPFEQAALRIVQERTQRLGHALRNGRQQDAILHAQALLGLGPGLTPSGDDVLLGLFAVLHLPASPCEGWLHGGAPVLVGAGDATNAISLAALKAAAQGRVRASIAALLHELLHGGGPALQAAIARVLAIGASSGSDIAAGLACGLEVQLFHGSQRS